MEWEGWCVSRTITDRRTDADTDVVLEPVSTEQALGDEIAIQWETSTVSRSTTFASVI